MNTNERPMSPHLQIYRWQWTMALSILHRAMSVSLAVGTLLGGVAVARSPGLGACRLQTFIGHWFGRLLLFGWTWALFYHLCNGIRHLVWDTGRGFELSTAAKSGYLVGFVSIVLAGL